MADKRRTSLACICMQKRSQCEKATLYELARYVADNRNWKIKNVNDTAIHFCNSDGSDNAEWIDMIELPLRNTVATFKKSMGLLDEYDWEKD